MQLINTKPFSTRGKGIVEDAEKKWNWKKVKQRLEPSSSAWAYDVSMKCTQRQMEWNDEAAAATVEWRKSFSLCFSHTKKENWQNKLRWWPQRREKCAIKSATKTLSSTLSTIHTFTYRRYVNMRILSVAREKPKTSEIASIIFIEPHIQSGVEAAERNTFKAKVAHYQYKVLHRIFGAIF